MLVADVDTIRQHSSGHACAEARDVLPAPWYAIWTRSHCEHLVARQLAGKGFSPFLPEMGTWSRRNGTPHVVRVPMFPGYLFLQHAMNKETYIEILKARGVVRVLEDGWTRLTPIAHAEIESLQRVVQADVPVFPHAHLRQGDRVRIVEGPLAGLEGLFIQDKPTKGRLVLSINLLQRSVAVEVDCAFVE